MNAAFIDKTISAHDGPERGDLKGFFSRLTGGARRFRAGEKVHAIISGDIITPARRAIFETSDIEVSECDFTDLSAIDGAVRKNTAFAYCEYPSARTFRTFDFEKIHEFLTYFRIELACGFFFSDPRCCNINSGADWAPPGDFRAISKSAANARRICDILTHRPGFGGLKIVHVNSSKYADYKNTRKISRVDGSFISVSGGPVEKIDGIYRSIAAALGPAGLITGELNDGMESYYELAADYINYRLYKCMHGENGGGGDKPGFIIKAGADPSVINGLNEI
ncbi:MAG: hypothetical protein A2008_13260 [Candidatus Wallbacteria bacterium GWC2_49_35]|uniref:Uncharacterized protein n=1 Tax=Candidatus Wallbacteria bacterium GWC2_49_35 TaxID=1817813 RepID=A0A1F7WZB9_9BACT|nr:MAG: hypothetical protein A2008_13260 [Candidatus Wallbacteria bacterium GWC2_49_35]HBC76321.1 hypothetical protein [Candidatus Wallbacteria bacterium]